MTDTPATRDGLNSGRPTVLRGGTVLTMDRSDTVLERGDVLIVDDRIEAVGTDLEVPDDAVEIDASGGIVMPGMIDTHRHMWQTAMRGYGADWTLTQYFVFYYLNWGKIFRPEDIHAGNLLAAVEALDAGVTTVVDWSHGLQTVDHAEAAADALTAMPGRYVLAYGNIQAGPWEWVPSADVRAFIDRRRGGKEDLLQVQLAFDVTGDPAFPEKAAFEAAREQGLRVTTHAGVWGATNDNSIQLMCDHGFMTPDVTYVHAASLSHDSYQRIAASGAFASVSTESEQSAGQGYPPTYALRRHGIPVSLSMDTSVWWSGDLFNAMRATLSADRSRDHLDTQADGDTVVYNALRADDVVRWGTRGGAQALDLDDLVGSLEPGKKADVVLVKNDRSPAMYPILHPYGHVVFQATRADVHSVFVNGRAVKYAHELVDVDLQRAKDEVGRTIDYLRSEMGEQEWRSGMSPDLPEQQLFDNPYQYTDWEGGRGAKGVIPSAGRA
ncbi:amidohydrolase family protein [Egicoccus sp. AB-alg2]|uniref:amidohydrolase family protein n=1 Tax=Egicoccus sp. AB-alg2 TaxID=3242693 RepID=UPI00359D1B15